MNTALSQSVLVGSGDGVADGDGVPDAVGLGVPCSPPSTNWPTARSRSASDPARGRRSGGVGARADVLTYLKGTFRSRPVHRYAVCHQGCDPLRSRSTVTACPAPPSPVPSCPPSGSPTTSARPGWWCSTPRSSDFTLPNGAWIPERSRAVPARGAPPRRGLRRPHRGALRPRRALRVHPPDAERFETAVGELGIDNDDDRRRLRLRASASGRPGCGGCSARSATTGSRCSTGAHEVAGGGPRARDRARRPRVRACSGGRAPRTLGRQGRSSRACSAATTTRRWSARPRPRSSPARS